jgi:hypothetical protein
VSASWSTVEALRDDPALLAEVEAAFAEQDEQRAEREAICSEGAGSVRGEAPHFTCLPPDKWIHKTGGVPRAIIPPLAPIEAVDLSEDEQRESFEVRKDGSLLHPRALELLPKIVLTPEGELDQLGDGLGENQEQARAPYELGHPGKAQRHACCRRFGRRVECAGRHAFMQIFGCGQRLCPACAPKIFKELFTKYVALYQFIKKRPGWVLAKLDFTVRNTGQMPSRNHIRWMNRGVRATLKRLLKGKKGWGYLWCDEFGFENTNLHCHGLYFGPWLPQARLQEAWTQEIENAAQGNEELRALAARPGKKLRVGIESAQWDFPRALYHLLKYVLKPPGNDPKHRARLEDAYSGVRRVHTLGLFYNACLPQEHDGKKELRCPLCDGHLFNVGGYCRVGDLEASGLRDLDDVRRETGRLRVFSRAGPP